jgi:6-phosphogluconolactonase
VAQHPVTGLFRITLTGNVINNAARVWFMITGAGKADRVAEIFKETKSSRLFPAAHIHPVHGELSWYLDESAEQLI